MHGGALGVPTALWQEVPASLELNVPGQQSPILAVGDLMLNCSAERGNRLPGGRITAPPAGAAGGSSCHFHGKYRLISPFP